MLHLSRRLISARDGKFSGAEVMTVRMSGVEALIKMLAEAGVRRMFGNPGTTELPLMDALAVAAKAGRSEIDYTLGLQEVPVMAMADGYAMASRGLGVVNLHASCGLGNAMGMLYNAHREGTPLLVTAGQTDRRIRFEEPILWGDMVGVAKPWTKWSAEVERVEDLPAAVRRAIQIALTPPTGPVFLSLPMDVQSAVAELDTTPAAPLDRRVRPPIDALRRAAELLAGAKNPGIVAGSRIVEADAVRALVAVAEALGAPVFSESATSHGRLPFPADHPLYGQQLPLWAPDVQAKLAEFDVLLVAGLDLLRMYVHHEPPQAVPSRCRIVHLDEDPRQIGKNYPVEVGLVGDVRTGLEELAAQIPATMNGAAATEAKRRGEQRGARHAEIRDALRLRVAGERAARPMLPSTLMETVGRVLPADVAVVEEAVTTTDFLLERLGILKNTDGYFAHRGWALGWGLGCAIGVKLAWPERPTLALLGDGASLYGIQGLWTAARYRIPVTFVICNNNQYRILKDGARMLGMPAAQQGEFLGMDLTPPTIDFVQLSQSLGVEACRVDEPDALAEVLQESLHGDRPRLIDVRIAVTRNSQFG
ncbi:MAG: thiamine pyrophosphate-binding protein [Planctomycetia bacterium]|nr:thiamine pyrophosphate-binding protein [Planctomycetia bacterium]